MFDIKMIEYRYKHDLFPYKYANPALLLTATSV